MSNPIPFNPDLMTVKQLKECADTLSLVFDALGRHVDNENIIFNLMLAKDHMSKEWSKS